MRVVAIIVPVYRQKLTDLERISYKQLLHILGAFEIIVIAPENLSMPQEIEKEKIKVEYFPAFFFQNVDSYSRLMLSRFLYQRFIRYQYILIYQLDAFVFKNELMYFCGLDCDYIGAPWISGFCEYSNLKRKVLYVGNGGFSLRRVEACMDALRCNRDLLEQYQGRNEDAFFSACDGRNFRTASMENALAFSFEREVQTCFALNNYSMPFGCHAWERYDLKFWKKEIEKFGYEVEELDGGEEDRFNQDEYMWMRRNVKLMEDDDLFFGIPKKIGDLLDDSDGSSYYLWGAGFIGRYAKDLFIDLGMHLEGFIDTGPDKQGRVLEGLMVCSPKDIKIGKKIIVTAGRRYYSDIDRNLRNLNMRYLKDYIYFEDILPDE